MLVEKTILFLYHGALGCILPFLTLHLLQAGANYPTISVTIFLVTLISLLGLPLTSLLLRKCKNYTLVLIGNLVVALLCYDMLLLLAPGEENGGKVLDVQLYCDGTGSAIYVSNCDGNVESCSSLLGGDHWQLLRLDNCSCVEKEQIPFSATSTVANHLVCFQGEEYNHCEVAEELYTANSILVEYKKHSTNQSEHACNFPAHKSMVNGNRAKTIYCIDCNIRCWGKSQVASPGEALLASGETLDTIWIFEYVLARGVAEMCSFSAIFLLTNSNSDADADVIAMWAAAIFSPLSGAFADWYTVQTGKENFAPCFYSFSLLMIATIILSILLRENHTWFPSILQCERRLFHQNAEFFWFTGITILLGALWSYSDLFLPCFYNSLCADKTLIGLTAVSAFLLALPLLLKSSTIIERVGTTSCIIFAFIAYAARYTGYVFISDVRWSLIIELFRSLCFQLPWLALLHHATRIVPRDLQATAQTITVILFFHVGRSFGCLVGSYIASQDTFITTFMFFATVSGFAACIYFAVNLFFFFNKNFDL